MIDKKVKWYRNGITPQQRFYSYIETNPDTGCWEFMGLRNKKGYGIFTAENRKFSAHRFSWLLHKGEIPNGMYVCHACDNPPCVNPDHLFLGTQKDNMQDMIKKGRGADVRGENNPRSTIYDEGVIQIRKMWDMGVSANEIAVHFCTPLKTIRNIISGATWTHLPLCQRKSSNRGSRLTEKDILEIKRLYSFGILSQAFIGKMFKLKQAQVSRIINGESWT